MEAHGCCVIGRRETRKQFCEGCVGGGREKGVPRQTGVRKGSDKLEDLESSGIVLIGYSREERGVAIRIPGTELQRLKDKCIERY